MIQNKIKILLADDNSIERTGIVTRLRLVSQVAGIEASVTEVSDGDELIEQASADKYDLVLTDNRMKRIHGIEAIRTIRASRNSIPIYLLSKNQIPENEWKEVRANGYVRKPLEYEVRTGRIGIGELIKKELDRFDSELGEIIRRYSRGQTQ
ncbi:response regulator transcription factor [Candidatus Pacearchaeota archaeon]|nr:response regulator transcription factor [Candidatus Pacearchaeota archaeon]